MPRPFMAGGSAQSPKIQAAVVSAAKPQTMRCILMAVSFVL